MFTRLFLISTLVVLSTAPVFGEKIYVSSGHEIWSIDSVSGAALALIDDQGNRFNPRGLTVGPDGNLYIAGSRGAIYRFDPTQGEGPSNPTVIANVPGNPDLEGLAFAANFDLYVSTSESSGHVYRLHFVPIFPDAGADTTNPTLGSPTECAPNRVACEAFSFGSGAGIAFGENGNLLVAKNTSNGGISYAVATNNYSSASSLPPGIKNPIGMAVNTCGEILVAVGKKIERRDKKTGALLGDDYVTFEDGKVAYIGVTSTNEVFAVVTSNGGSGQVYRVRGTSSAGTDILSCAEVESVTALAELDNLVGLAVPASRAYITKSFGGKGLDNRCGTSDDLLTPSSQTFNFGPHFFTLSFKQLIHCFDVKVTAAMSRPQRVTFNGNFPGGTEATKYSSKGSFAVEYLAHTEAISGIDYADLQDGVQTSALFFTLLSLETPPRFPGMAKSDLFETLIEREYDQDISQYFFPTFNPDEDPGESGTDDDISRFVVFNGPVTTPVCQFNLKQPAFSGNPPWTQGSTLRVQFNCSNNGNFSNLQASLTVIKLNDDGSQTPQPVVSKTSAIGNKFSTGSGNNFTFELDTAFLAVGRHQLIITSNRFAPRDGNDGNPALPDLDPPIIVRVE